MQGVPPPEGLRDKIAEELGDVYISADLIAAQLDIDVEGAIRRKFNSTSNKIGSDVKL